MSNGPSPGGYEPPSGKKIALGSGIAVIVALFVLVTVIWPAEYGRDPTGIGGLLGITGMSAGNQTETIEVATLDPISGNEILREVEIPDFGEPVPLPNPEVAQNEATAPESETLTIELGVDAQTEIKAVLRKGKVIVFDWAVDEGVVHSEFHGHTPEFGENFWVMYKEDKRGAAGGQGSLVAPFDGEHGWYWQNLNTHPVTITLNITGYYDDLLDYSALF